MLNPRLILVSIIWGVNFAFVKFALHDFAPLSFTIVRFALAALFLIAIMLAKHESLFMERRDIVPVIGLGLIGITLYNLLFMYGLNYTTASNSALFISSSPLFAVLIKTVAEKTSFSARGTTGLMLSSLGVFLVIWSKPGGITLSRQAIAGDLLTLCAALFWALYTMKSKPLLEKYSAVKVTAYAMASGTVMLLPLGARELLHQSWSAVSFPSWAALAFTLWYDGVKKFGVTRTIVYHYLVPFVAVLFAALFLGERITIPQILGGLAILAGVVMVQQVRNR